MAINQMHHHLVVVFLLFFSSSFLLLLLLFFFFLSSSTTSTLHRQDTLLRQARQDQRVAAEARERSDREAKQAADEARFTREQLEADLAWSRKEVVRLEAVVKLTKEEGKEREGELLEELERAKQGIAASVKQVAGVCVWGFHGIVCARVG